MSVVATQGLYTGTIDGKGRLILPARLRRILQEQGWGRDLFVTSTTGEVVEVYPIPVWKDIEKKLKTIAATAPPAKKFLVHTSFYGQSRRMDTLGRIAIPPNLLESAALKGRVALLADPFQAVKVLNRRRLKELVASPLFGRSPGGLAHAAPQVEILRGAFCRSLDTRCRLRLPAAFREALGSVPLAIVAWQDCVELVPAWHWNSFREEWIASGPEEHRHFGRLQRKRLTSTEEPLPIEGLSQIDADGRIRLPRPFALHLREHGNEVILLGHLSSVQVWDRVCFADHLPAGPWRPEDEPDLGAVGI